MNGPMNNTTILIFHKSLPCIFYDLCPISMEVVSFLLSLKAYLTLLSPTAHNKLLLAHIKKPCSTLVYFNLVARKTTTKVCVGQLEKGHLFISSWLLNKDC